MADPTPPQHDPVAFEEKTDDNYAEQFAASCAAPVPMRKGYLLKGVCPRCRGNMEFPVVDTVFRSTVTPDVTVAQNASDDVPMLCRCPLPHERRPGDEEGCGAFWNIQLTDDPAS
jgi:hypothetical protein